jgi:hypothetical protein
MRVLLRQLSNHINTIDIARENLVASSARRVVVLLLAKIFTNWWGNSRPSGVAGSWKNTLEHCPPRYRSWLFLVPGT